MTEHDKKALLNYLTRQIDHFFPDGGLDTNDRIASDLDEALERLLKCMDSVKMWRGTGFHYLHSEKNTVFLYYLANTIWRNRKDTTICEKLFYLNKALNGFHCFTIRSYRRFFRWYSVGIFWSEPLIRAIWCSIRARPWARITGRPRFLEEGAVLYPGSAIIGDCLIRPRSYISQNTSVIIECQKCRGWRCIFWRSGDHDCETNVAIRPLPLF